VAAPSTFKIGLVQMRCSADPDDNLARAIAHIAGAAGRGAQIVCLPELFRSQYFCQAEDHANFDLAEHATSSSIDPLGNYFSYHSSQFDPVGVNNAGVNDPDIDKSLDTLKNSVDFEVILGAMADMQKAYAEKTVEIPLYYRKQVDLHAQRLGNFFANPTQAGPTWNVVDWFVNE